MSNDDGETQRIFITFEDEKEEEDDYDDTPLFTRTSSSRLKFEQSNTSQRTCSKTSNNCMKSNPIYTRLKKVPYSLPFLQASLFATLFEDIILQLRILEECNNPLRLFKVHTDMPDLVADKFSIPPTKLNIEECLDVKKFESEHFKLDKLFMDRDNLNKVLLETYLALALNNSYSPLVLLREQKQNHFEYQSKLKEEEAQNKTTRRELARQLRQQRNRIKSQAYVTNVSIDRIKSQVEDSTLIKEVRGRYIDKWQNARSEQHATRIYNKESKPSDAIKYYRSKAEEEQRVHTEIELVTNIQIDELHIELDRWNTKYDVDMEEVDLKITRLRIDFDEQVEKRLALEEMLKSHEEEIEAWKQFKIDRENARLYHLKMTNAAIAVQAWWRGLLVRLQLGPFQPPKKKKAGGKKK